MAVTLNVAGVPAVTVSLTGWEVITGSVFTVRVTALLVVERLFPSVTTTLNWSPLKAAVVLTVVSVAVLYPVPAPNAFQVLPDRYCQA